MPVYKDTPNNRKLNRVGQEWDASKKKNSKAPKKKKTVAMPKVLEEASPPAKLVAIMKQAHGSTTPRPLKLARPRTPPRTPRKKKLPMSEGVAKKNVPVVLKSVAPAPKKAPIRNILTEGDIELMIGLFKFSEASEYDDDLKWNFNNITIYEIDFAGEQGWLKKESDEAEEKGGAVAKAFEKKLVRFKKIITEKEKRNLTIKNLSKEDRDKLQKAIRKNKK